MTVTAEIIVDWRRVIEFFLDPIARRSGEALRER